MPPIHCTASRCSAWVLNATHAITYGHQLDKVQNKKWKSINVIISDKTKTLHFLDKCTRAITSPRIRWPRMKSRRSRTFPGTRHLSTSPNYMCNARCTMKMKTAWQRANKRAMPTSRILYPATTPSQQTWATSLSGISTSRASWRHYRSHWS